MSNILSFILVSGCGLVAIHTRCPLFESSHWQISYWPTKCSLYYEDLNKRGQTTLCLPNVNCTKKTKINKKRPGMAIYFTTRRYLPSVNCMEKTKINEKRPIMARLTLRRAGGSSRPWRGSWSCRRWTCCRWSAPPRLKEKDYFFYNFLTLFGKFYIWFCPLQKQNNRRY